ncbi:Protein translocase subunit SecD [Candidatus Terasakiella magnetica]|uniref:Protein translocase subunit SecD n=1 Tax=Candidatus Terasakiella magnetica TaxID=1867952 RepID=A0A1C3RCE8_9PROT|nr:protein translocase subunit SecD [Candidatus Terasakiella magnetica]SCA54941.1 Protein translocase subunit SecD [Candidatus Terasakiella magnetica]
MVYFAKWKIALVVSVCLLGVAFAAPNMLDRKTTDNLPGWLPNQQISLGLDLQGGSHLLLEVEAQTVINERLVSIVDAVRSSLRSERIRYTGLGVKDDAVHVQIKKPEQIDQAYDLVRKIDTGAETVTQGSKISITLTEDAILKAKRSAVEQSIEIVRRRIDETGTKEPNIQRQGDERILIQLPGIDNPEDVKRLLGKTAKMTFHLVNHNVSAEDLMAGRIPPGTLSLPDAENESRNYAVRRKVEVSGDMLIDSQPTFQDSRPVVSFTFNALGGKKFGQVTAKNVNRSLAIVLDGKVISAPNIQGPILGGSGVITGQFSVQEANDLSLLLRAGALPAPLVILEERTVGPGLGADSIAAGKIASIVGLIAVIGFMIVTYGRFGIYADVALMFNIILITAALSLLQATLTLPGIAGIVLTIGMAVDANVLIFERIREELRNGLGPIAAVDSGYKRAIKTIIDANVTTLIAAVLLFEFGSGPVRGFAVTLAIGILTSMFTAIMVTRLQVVLWLRKNKPKKLAL